MLFTYTDKDSYVPPSEVQRSLVATGGEDAPPSAVATAMWNPLAERSSQHVAWKEKGVATMYIMAAVGINKEDYRAKKLTTAMYEVPLMMIKAFKPTGQGRGDTVMCEMRPGFTETLPCDEPALAAIAASGISKESVLGPGRYGGELKLRTVHIPRSVVPSSGAMEAIWGTGARTAGMEITAVMETHSFRTPEGIKYEYMIVNPSEDAATAVLTAQAAAAAGDSSLALASTLATPFTSPVATLLESGEAAMSAAHLSRDPLAALLLSEKRAIEAASHRAGSEFHSTIPASCPEDTVRMTYYVELVAAANFEDADDIFIAWELQPCEPWKLVPSHDLEAGIGEYTAVQTVTQSADKEDGGFLVRHSAGLGAPQAAGVTQVARSKLRRWCAGMPASAQQRDYLFGGICRNNSVTRRLATWQHVPEHESHFSGATPHHHQGFGTMCSVAHFCYPIELHLVSSSRRLELTQQAPVITFTICTKDSLDRDRTLGRARYVLPLVAGSVDTVLHAYNSSLLLSDMECEYFLGGVDDSLSNSSNHLRTGQRTEKAGEITVRVNAARVHKQKSVNVLQSKLLVR
jgi:hypothetical protein